MSVTTNKHKSAMVIVSVVALVAAVGCGGMEPEAEQVPGQPWGVAPLEQGLDNQLAQPPLTGLSPRDGELRVRDRLDPTEPKRPLEAREQIDLTEQTRRFDEHYRLDRNEAERPPLEPRFKRVELTEHRGPRQGEFEPVPEVEWLPQPEIVPYDPRVELPVRGLNDLPQRLEGELEPAPAPTGPAHKPNGDLENPRADDDDDEDGRGR